MIPKYNATAATGTASPITIAITYPHHHGQEFPLRGKRFLAVCARRVEVLVPRIGIQG